MSSPLFTDVESSPAGLDLSDKMSKQAPKKTSFLRKWGPALAAIAGVIAVNVGLLGHNGGKIPALNQRQLQAQTARMERTQAVLDMEWDLVLLAEGQSRGLVFLALCAFASSR